MCLFLGKIRNSSHQVHKISDLAPSIMSIHMDYLWRVIRNEGDIHARLWHLKPYLFQEIREYFRKNSKMLIEQKLSLIAMSYVDISVRIEYLRHLEEQAVAKIVPWLCI